MVSHGKWLLAITVVSLAAAALLERTAPAAGRGGMLATVACEGGMLASDEARDARSVATPQRP